MAAVTPDTPFRLTGNTDLDSFADAIARTISGPSPMEGEADSIYDAIEPRGLTRLAAAMCWIERRNETDPGGLRYYPRSYHNAWAIKNADGTWARYSSYAEAAAHWVDRILGPTYADLTTLGELIHRYAPWSDGNNPEAYGKQAAEEINALPLITNGGTMTQVQFSGAKRKVDLSVPLTVNLLPASHTIQRPGIAATIDGGVFHETGNYNPGMDAEHHYTFLLNGARDNFGNQQQVSFHLCVDADSVVQMVPFTEVTWHGGDGSAGARCNYTKISMEICVNDNNRDKVKIRRNAEEVFAAALLSMDIGTVDHLKPHHWCCEQAAAGPGCHYGCPESMIADGYERQFIANVASWMEGTTPGPVKVYPPAVMAPAFDGKDKTVGGVTFYALNRQYTAARELVKCYQYADTASQEVRDPLKKGEALIGQYLTKNAGHWWVVSNFGSRILAEDLAPNIVALS